MKSFLAILKRELKAYIDQPMAYVLAVVFLVINNVLFFQAIFVSEVASLRPMFNFMPWMLLFFISALTMRTWAEEKQQKTLLVLLSYPVQIWKIILAKFIATVLFVCVVLAFTLLIPISMSVAGNFDTGVIFAQYLGTFFLVMAMVAIGQWASSLTRNQVIAYVFSGAMLFAFFLISIESIILALPFPLNTIAQQLGALSHFQAMTRGVIDIRDVVYFISLAFVFLSLSYVWLARHKMVPSSKQYRTLQTSMVIIIAISIVVNLFGQGLTVRADLTEQKIYSLSATTKSTLRALSDQVSLTLYRSENLPPQVDLVSRDIQDILSDYKKFGGRNIDYTIKYPDKDPDITAEAQQAGVPAIRFNTVKEGEFSLQEGHLGLVIQYLDQKHVLPFIQGIDDLEYQLTKAIVSLQRTEQVRVGYVSDFGGKTLEEWSLFASAVKEDLVLEQVRLTAESSTEEQIAFTPEIPTELDALVIASPTEPYTADAIAAIEDYIARGGKILWFVSGVNVNPAALQATPVSTGLERLLAEQGITVEQDLIADLISHQSVNFNQGLFSYVLPYPLWITAMTQKHVLSGSIQQVTMPWASSLTLSDQEGLYNLATTTESGVAQTDSFILVPDQLSALAASEQKEYTVAAVHDSVPSDNGDLGRWVVIANNSFLDDSLLQQHPQNLAFAMNAIDWLSQNEALLTIRTKTSQPTTLTWESPGQQSRVKWGNNAGVPILIAILGAAWLYRRKRMTKKSV